MLPSRRASDRILQRHALVVRFDERGAKRGEAIQRVGDGRSGVRHPFVMQSLCLAPSLADDPVMGFDHRIRDRGGPFDDADGKDGMAPVGVDVAQAIGEVALPLTAQSREAVRGHVGEQVCIKRQRAQELQPVEQPVRRG